MHWSLFLFLLTPPSPVCYVLSHPAHPLPLPRGILLLSVKPLADELVVVVSLLTKIECETVFKRGELEGGIENEN